MKQGQLLNKPCLNSMKLRQPGEVPLSHPGKPDPSCIKPDLFLRHSICSTTYNCLLVQREPTGLGRMHISTKLWNPQLGCTIHACVRQGSVSVCQALLFTHRPVRFFFLGVRKHTRPGSACRALVDPLALHHP